MEEYKGYKLYFEDRNYKKILEDIIEKKFQVEKEYKNDNRTYVAKIKYNGKNYILKKFYIRKTLKRFLSIFKEGESIRTFKNISNFIKEIPELAEIYGAVIKRKGIFIEEEFVLMEYIEGDILVDDENCKRILGTVKKIHKLGRFHGDCNPHNFIYDRNKNIRILDTKMKKMGFGNYRAHYDILTLFKHFKVKPKYPYNENIYYKIAYMVREYRNGR